MATDVFVGHFLQLIVVTALVTRVSASQITVLDGFTGVEQCDVKCTAEFADSKASSQNVCNRGCRLMSVIELMAQRQTGNSLEDVQNSCLKTCKEAYADSESEAACAVGCQGQLPAIAARHRELSAAYNEQMDEMSSWMSVGRYYHRMMQCIADQIEHQLHVSWYTYQPQAADEQLTLVLDAPHVDDDHASAVEQKTSSHVQTNLEPAAAGDMTKLAMVQLDSNDAVADDAAKDWLLCVRRRGNVIRKLALVMIGIPLIIVIYFTVSSALSTPHSTQRVAVRSDVEYVKQLDDMELLLSTEPQELYETEAPLPIKMPVNKV